MPLVAPLLCKSCGHPISDHYRDPPDSNGEIEVPKSHHCHVCDKGTMVTRGQTIGAAIAALFVGFLLAYLVSRRRFSAQPRGS